MKLMKDRDVSCSSPEARLCVLYAMNPTTEAVGELGVMKNNGQRIHKIEVAMDVGQ
jgi:hypothetical protein